jgi:drug/metabolite transporter (DMT)-like permease
LTSGQKPTLSHTKYAAPSGALMGLNGYLTLYLSSKLPASVLFPTVSVIQTLFNIIFSRVFFKERLTRMQIVGIILGAVSVILIR